MKKLAFIIILVLTAMPYAQAASDEGKNPDTTRLCEGKGPHVKLTVKIEGRTIKGSCQIGFKPAQVNALDYEAMRAPAVQNACKGKARGTTLVMNVNGKQVLGKCDLVFKSNHF
ncbi:hypothetical protein [Acinetobacter schindleri]|uniref:hypothetical protein n=1 Tax=Acinetobacter schindleri TaxID=108981 RepID=UPI002899B365|nr:hypothetical protein [Acinetobacter schindleri]